jgi:hypothetical protein
MENMVDISNKHSVDPKIEQYLERVYRISKSFGTKRGYQAALRNLKSFVMNHHHCLIYYLI